MIAFLPINAAAADFPVPRAESEFAALCQALGPRADSIAGVTNTFIQLTQPYGPLDLTVAQADSSSEASQVRNFFLGWLGGRAKVDAAALADRFHCGPECASQRREHLASLLPAIRAAAVLFREAHDLSVVAVWTSNGHRLNNYFFENDQYLESIPSTVMGFVPSGQWHGPMDATDVLAHVGLDVPSRDRILKLMREGDLAAIVKNRDGSVRAIWGGVSDNEAGFIFLGSPSPLPRVGDELPGGGSFVAIVRVTEGVYFYTTS